MPATLTDPRPVVLILEGLWLMMSMALHVCSPDPEDVERSREYLLCICQRSRCYQLSRWLVKQVSELLSLAVQHLTQVECLRGERGRDFGLWMKLQAMCCHMFRKQVYDDLVHMITVCGMQSHFLTKVKGCEGLKGFRHGENKGRQVLALVLWWRRSRMRHWTAASEAQMRNQWHLNKHTHTHTEQHLRRRHNRL